MTRSLLILFYLCKSLRFASAFVVVPRVGSNIILSRNRSSDEERRKIKSMKLKNEMNPFQSLLDGVFSGSSSSSSCVALDKNQLKTAWNDLSSWKTLRGIWSAHPENENPNFRNDLKSGFGTASPLHTVRRFGSKDDDERVRVTLYRDSASWCPYCQKVWMTLEEKQINYKIEFVNMRCYGDKTKQFLQIQPNGNIPVAIIDNQTYRQSNDILQVLETNFPNHKSLLPNDDQVEQNRRAKSLMQLERQLFGAWMYWLTSKDNSQGSLRKNFKSVLQTVEQELSTTGPFFLGNDVSMVDFMFMPFVERMMASLLYFKAFPMRGLNNKYPNLNRWMDAMETLPSYQLTKSDYYTHCWDLPPQLGSCVTEDDTYQDAINGFPTWEYPLQDYTNLEPGWDWCQDAQKAKLEAVERLTHNHVNIIKFAARGASDNNQNSIFGYSAPLADPKATSNNNIIDSLDAILRIITIKLLSPDITDNNNNDDNDTIMSNVAKNIVIHGGNEHAQGIISSLVYLRNRIGVPRDMKLPAAQQLRSHINWSIGHILNHLDE